MALQLPDLQASTPAVAPQNDAGDDDDDEPLNEDDDDDDLDDVEQGEDINTHHLVLAQFDKVTLVNFPNPTYTLLFFFLGLGGGCCGSSSSLGG